MIIYLDDDGPYLSWVTHHHDGFVIDWLRQPTQRPPILHRTACKRIRVAGSKKTHWTTGRRLKACSTNLQQLVQWAEREAGREPNYCEQCNPQTETPLTNAADHHHLTKLEKEILDYVLEIAVFHLDHPDQTYQLTVGDVAACMNKTIGQIAAALIRLIQSDNLRLDNGICEKTDIRSQQRVFPTRQGLRREPAFAKLSDREIDAELAGLDREF